MAIAINDTDMTSDQNPHIAWRADGEHRWEVSWLPGRLMDATARSPQ